MLELLVKDKVAHLTKSDLHLEIVKTANSVKIQIVPKQYAFQLHANLQENSNQLLEEMEDLVQ